MRGSLLSSVKASSGYQTIWRRTNRDSSSKVRRGICRIHCRTQQQGSDGCELSFEDVAVTVASACQSGMVAACTCMLIRRCLLTSCVPLLYARRLHQSRIPAAAGPTTAATPASHIQPSCRLRCCRGQSQQASLCTSHQHPDPRATPNSQTSAGTSCHTPWPSSRCGCTGSTQAARRPVCAECAHIYGSRSSCSSSRSCRSRRSRSSCSRGCCSKCKQVVRCCCRQCLGPADGL